MVGHDSLPPPNIMRGITNNDDLGSIHGSMFQGCGIVSSSQQPVICIEGEWATKSVELWSACLLASGVGKLDRLMLPNLGGGSRSHEISVFGHDSLPPPNIMGGIANNDDLGSMHVSMFQGCGFMSSSQQPVICMYGEWATKSIELWSAFFPAGGLGMPNRSMLPNLGGGNQRCEMSGFGLTPSLPPLDNMRGITNNDDLGSIHGSMFRGVGSCRPRSNL